MPMLSPPGPGPMLTLGGRGRCSMPWLVMGERVTIPIVPAAPPWPMLLFMLLADIVPTVMVAIEAPVMVLLAMLTEGFMVVVGGTMPGFMVGIFGGNVCCVMLPIICPEPMLTMGPVTMPGLMPARMAG